jgi:signal transduction histidine kinase
VTRGLRDPSGGVMTLTEAFLDRLDQMGDWGLLATDTDLVVTRWNRWLEQRSGLAAADVVGRALFKIFPDLITRKMDRYYHQALTGQTVLLSQRFHKYILPLPPTTDAAGQTHLQQTSRIVALMDGAAVCGTLTLIEDVTERVAYEAELRARARQQAAVAAVARSALGGRDMAELAREVIGHMHEILDADFTEVLELSPDGQEWGRLAGNGWTDKVVPAFKTGSVPWLHQYVPPATDSGTAVCLSPAALAKDSYLRSHGVACALMTPITGAERPFGLLGAYTRYPRQFSPGELLFTQALADVLGVAAEHKRLECELQLRVNVMAEGDRRKDEFLAMLGHEIRNPLAPVRNGLQILRAKAGADAIVDQTTDIMTRQIDLIVRLVDDLLDVSRITQGKVVLRRERIDLASIVNQAVETARPLIDSRGHKLSVNIQREAIHIDGDPSRLAQILWNLLSNAAKYTEPGGSIRLDACQVGNEVVVSVKDTGVGISAEMLLQVFDLFIQVDHTLERSEGGLGIGLTLVRRLVELHGGSVRAVSDGLGCGSEFIVRLPASPNSSSKEVSVQAVEISSKAPSVSHRILVVDDNVDSADSLATLLELYGHKVHTVYSGTAALEVALSFQPSIILLDIGLPGMDGYEVARRLRENTRFAKVTLVALTGYGQEDDRRRTQQAGFDLHLVKPVAPEQLNHLLARSSE